MNIKQKAKAYERALGLMVDCKPDENGFIHVRPDEIFPELRESYYEEIRKEMLEYCYKRMNNEFSSITIHQVKRWIAWLEKQADQKSADKVEPKFKVGDWIVQKDLGIYKIVEICESWYEVISYKDGIQYSIAFDKENDCHLWSIQDAKDGDVLATDSWLYVFKYTNNKALIQFYCNCPITGKPYKWCFLSDDCYLEFYIAANIHPATIEQRELLFQKVKEAGYEWNPEKKELKKIEQKPAWSEEDEKIYNRICNLIHNAAFESYDVDEDGKELGEYAKITNWFKSLKERVQPKQEWSEDDKGNLLDVKCIIDEVWHNQDVREEIDHSGEELESLWHWLDDIWQRVEYPQTTWKPSDRELGAILLAISDERQKGSDVAKDLLKIYQQIKKLREE